MLFQICTPSSCLLTLFYSILYKVLPCKHMTWQNYGALEIVIVLYYEFCVCVIGDDLICCLLYQVETIEGYKDLQIPCGIQPGETLKMAKLGVPNINKPSVRGDHYFIVRVEIPKDIRSGVLIDNST